MGTFAYLLNRDQTTPTVLVNSVVVCLAFYFGSHGATPASPPGAHGTAVASPRPRIVRALLLLGFAGLAGVFLYRGTSLERLPQLIEIWEVLGGYLLGLSLSWIFHRRAHETDLRRRIALVFRDLSAAGALAVTVFACYAMVAGLVTPFGGTVEQGLSLVLTYYFGSRVIAH